MIIAGFNQGSNYLLVAQTPSTFALACMYPIGTVILPGSRYCA